MEKIGNLNDKDIKNIKNNINKDFLITRNGERDNLSGFLQSLTMNKYTFKFNELDKKFEEMQFNKINSFECTVLDFFVFNEFIDDNLMINLKKHIDNKIKENKLSENFEFKLKSSKTIEKIFERNNLFLFETFFINKELEITDDFIFGVNNQLKYLKDINFMECLKIILKKDNERMAIYLMRLWFYIYHKLEVKSDIEEFELNNGSFLTEYFKVLFEKKRWFNLIKTILDLIEKDITEEEEEITEEEKEITKKEKIEIERKKKIKELKNYFILLSNNSSDKKKHWIILQTE